MHMQNYSNFKTPLICLKRDEFLTTKFNLKNILNTNQKIKLSFLLKAIILKNNLIFLNSLKKVIFLNTVNLQKEETINPIVKELQAGTALNKKQINKFYSYRKLLKKLLQKSFKFNLERLVFIKNFATRISYFYKVQLLLKNHFFKKKRKKMKLMKSIKLKSNLISLNTYYTNLKHHLYDVKLNKKSSNLLKLTKKNFYFIFLKKLLKTKTKSEIKIFIKKAIQVNLLKTPTLKRKYLLVKYLKKKLNNKLFKRLRSIKKTNVSNKKIFNSKKVLKSKNLNKYLKNLKKKYKLNKSKTNHSVFYKKLVGLLIKKGGKKQSLKIINKALLITSLNLKVSINRILSKLYDRLKTSVEIKKIKIRRSLHLVPFPVNLKRKTFLIVKWILFALSVFKTNKGLEYQLSEEFSKVLKKEYSLSYKSKKYQIYKSFKYRSNMHFRW